MTLNKRMDAEPRDRLAITINEQALFWLSTSGAKSQLLDGGRPKWTGSLFVTFAEDPDRLSMPVDIANSEGCRLACSRSRVIQK
jgi:hypothetical protein